MLINRFTAVLAACALSYHCVAAAPSQETQSQQLTLDCVINPSVVADLGSGVPGLLDRVLVDRADVVAVGDVVAELEAGVELAARDLARARAEKHAEIDLRRVNAAFGRRQYKRSEDLFQRKVISSNDIDERKTEASIASIELRRAQDNRELAALELARAEQVLKRRVIKSPISGVVMERFKTIGEYVDEQPVLRVAQLDPLHVEVFVPVERLGEIRPGMSANVWSDVVEGQEWQARVVRVDRVADVASGTYGVRLVLPNPDYHVPAGLRCRLAFQLDDEPGAEPPSVAAPLNEAEAVPEAASEAIDASQSITPTAASLDADASVIALPLAGAEAEEESVAVIADTTAVIKSIEPICQRTAPFDDEREAEAMAAQLRAGGLNVSVEPRTVKQARGHRVVTAPISSRDESRRLIKRLEQAGVKDYFLTFHNRAPKHIELGLYSSKRMAEQRAGQLTKLGFNVRTKPWLRDRVVYSLIVSGSPDAAAAQRLSELSTATSAAPDKPDQCGQLASR